MRILTAQTPYGYQELRQVHHRYMMLALLMAITLQFTIIGTYQLSEWFKPIDPPILKVHKLPPDILPPPLHPFLTPPTFTTMPGRFSFGTPVPIPDCEVQSETPFASQDDLRREADRGWIQVGNISENDEVKIDEPDPLPSEIRLIDREPMIVSRSFPEYPEIARRAGLEGMVFVQILINKDGKVKKAILAKTNDDVFNEAALAAAQKWVFTPALRQGKPVTVWVSIPFRFRLKEN